MPFPRLHFLVPALAPLYAVRDLRYRPARLEHMFSDAFAAHSQLLRADPRHSRYLACGLLLRGSWLHARPGLGGDSALSAVLAAPRAQAAPAQPGAQPAKLGRSPRPPELATACSQD